MAAAIPDPDEEGSLHQFEAAMMRIIHRPSSADFKTVTSKVLVSDLFNFASVIFPRKESMETLRDAIRKHISHDEMEAFVSALEKYMERIHPDFCEKYCGSEQMSAFASLDLMSFTMTLKFLFMEYVNWEEVNAVNEEGKEILKGIAGRFLPILKKLKDMRSLITDGESRQRMAQAIEGTSDSQELLARLLAEEDECPVKETLMEDFYNKHARQDLWDKVYEIADADDFLDKNPSGNVCCYCLHKRLDCGNDFAIVDACWDLYCLHCVKFIGFALGGECARVQCSRRIYTYVTTNTYLKFRDEVNRNALGPYEKHFLEPTEE